MGLGVIMRYSVETNLNRSIGFLGGGFLASNYPEIENLIAGLNRVSLPVVPGYAKFQGHTPVWNAAMEYASEELDWETQPFIDPNEPRIAAWKGDMAKIMPDGMRVLIEIELGNAASAFRDLAKFELGRKLDSFDFFLLGVPGPQANKEIQYATSFDEILKKKELYKLFINTPCVIFEIEPPGRIDLSKASGLPKEHFKGRWGPDMSKRFISDYNLKSQMGIIN